MYSKFCKVTESESEFDLNWGKMKRGNKKGIWRNLKEYYQGSIDFNTVDIIKGYYQGSIDFNTADIIKEYYQVSIDFNTS